MEKILILPIKNDSFDNFSQFGFSTKDGNDFVEIFDMDPNISLTENVGVILKDNWDIKKCQYLGNLNLNDNYYYLFSYDFTENEFNLFTTDLEFKTIDYVKKIKNPLLISLIYKQFILSVI